MTLITDRARTPPILNYDILIYIMDFLPYLSPFSVLSSQNMVPSGGNKSVTCGSVGAAQPCTYYRMTRGEWPRLTWSLLLLTRVNWPN
ncbi:hypothetical protein QCA50_005515 [Cerrena zonata]|uniref:Uncharacterized protein n=1 Tax=Cerrena zonata TaxID=2478898 RepID=A0AAW0GAH0_9APHY